ncbi:hypothetical protein [Bacillus pacificus]|uniref:hypothetical protein n=1 Tax=Bacillus pacificus TaxID=2026187 RepID=UPI0023D8B016|nr:hypothetical protein [Bacillus pacificus]MDF0736471.1 hypothetical protein [Bacillus pacificus]
MKIDEVIDLLKVNGFKEKKFIKKRVIYNQKERKQEIQEFNILEFEFVFVNEVETELYIVEEKDSLFTYEEIEEFNIKIAAFLTFLGNSPIKYNVNLVLLCPLNLKNLDEEDEREVRYILGHERNKYNCRKIFLDTANQNFEEELSILPSLPINVQIENLNIGYGGLLEQVKLALGEDLYQELNKFDEEIDIRSIVKHLNVKGEGNE